MQRKHPLFKRTKIPYLTFTILFALLVAFGFQQTNPITDMFVGLPWDRLNNEYYRLLTASFLHFGWQHLGSNMFGIFLGGYQLETLIGWRWFLAVYVFSALSGSLMSSLFLSQYAVAAGASTAVCGIFSTMLIIALRFGDSQIAKDLVYMGAYMLLPTLLQFYNMQVDHFGHFGGAVGGLVIGFVIYSAWPSHKTRPEFSNLALFCSVLYILSIAFTHVIKLK